jgi:hypothetical protein
MGGAMLSISMLHAQTASDAAPQGAATAQQAAATANSPAEVQGGTITGTVVSSTIADGSGKKPAGTPLPGVSITATNTLTGKKYAAATDVAGTFRMTIPRSGRYVLRAEFAAFAPATAEVLLNTTQHEGRAEFALELASRAAARTAGSADLGGSNAITQTLGRGLQALRASGEVDTVEASAGAGAETTTLPTMTSLGGADNSGSDSVAISGQGGRINGLAGFNEDDLRERIQGAIADAQRNGGTQGDIANSIVSLIGGMAAGGPGGFRGPGGGFGGGPGGGGSGSGFGGGFGPGGFGGRGGGGFRNFNPTAIHGNVYYAAGNGALDATQFSLTGNALKPGYSTNRYGVALNGAPYLPGLTKPNTKQNLFLNWTGQRNANPVNVYATVPTLAQRTGNFNGLTQTTNGVVAPVLLYNPDTGTTYGDCSSYLNPGCNVITTPLNAQAQALLQYIPTPNTTTTGTGTTAENYNYQRITTAGSNNSQISARFTRAFGASAGQAFAGGGRSGGGQRRQQQTSKVLRQNMSVNYAYSHSASDLRGLMAALDGKTQSDGYNLTTGYQASYGRLSNSFTLGWNRAHTTTTNNFTYGQVDPAQAAGINIPKPLPAQAGLYNGVPGITLSNFTSVTDTQPADRLQETFSLSDMVSWRHGKHNFRFGFDLRRAHNNLIAGSNSLGQYTFTGYATKNPATGSSTNASGSSFADFLLGAPQNSAIQAGANKIYLREWVYDGYANDDFRVSSNITLNAGLRYEYFSPYTEENNRLVNLDHNADFTAFSRVTPGVAGAYSGAFPRSLVQPDRSLISPRLGIAWRPKFLKNTVVRGGYGINFNTGQYTSFANSMAYQQPFAVTQTNVAATQGCGTVTTPGATVASNFTLTNAFGCTSSAVLQNTFAINRAYRLGRVQAINMDIQKTLPLGTVLNIGYNGSFGSSLDLRRAPNRTISTITSNAQSIVYEDSIGESRFHSLSVNLRKRLQKGVSVQATYQYGHSIDDASSIGGAGNNTIVQNDQRIDLEFGNSTFDVRHKVTGNYVFELPFGPNRAFLNGGGRLSRALDGFSISGTFTFATGTYATPQYQNTVAQAATGNNYTLRPDRVFSQPIAGVGKLRRWFNPSAFTAPPTDRNGNLLAFGTASRNSIELPGTISNDMSLSKTVGLGDLRNFEARVTASNVFNTVQYNGANTVLNSSTFGQITGAAAPRKLSFQARYRF